MEIDILNDILSRTVSNLFQNKLKHMSYLSEDEGEKLEIFPQESLNPSLKNNQNLKINSHNSSHSNNSLNNQNQNEQPKKNLIEKIINNNMNNNQKSIKQNNQNNPKNQNQEINSPKIWCLTVGKKKYEESLARLQINEKMIASRTLINEMNLDQLIKEKARVKQELKKYDEDFFQVFKSKPTKENKEIMKPLYYYYQKLKLAITKKTNDAPQGENADKNDVQSHKHHGSVSSTNTNNPVFPSTMTNMTNNESILTQEMSYTNNNSEMTSEVMNNQSESNRQSKFSQNKNNGYRNSMNDAGYNNKLNNNMNYNVFHRKANSGGGVSSNSQMKVEDFNLNRGSQKRSLSKEEMNVLEQEYFSIKKEQNNLTQMLRNYQNEFQKTNNRKVKWTKDIKPVEKEYNKYKANKERIRQIKELFGQIENNNK